MTFEEVEFTQTGRCVCSAWEKAIDGLIEVFQQPAYCDRIRDLRAQSVPVDEVPMLRFTSAQSVPVGCRWSTRSGREQLVVGDKRCWRERERGPGNGRFTFMSQVESMSCHTVYIIIYIYIVLYHYIYISIYTITYIYIITYIYNFMYIIMYLIIYLIIYIYIVTYVYIYM